MTENYFTSKTRRGRIPGEGREVRSLDFTKDPEYPRFGVGLEVFESGQKAGRKGEGDRIENEDDARERWRHREEHDEHIG